MGYLNKSQLDAMGFKSLGDNVMISEKACIYKPHLIDIGSNVRIDDFCIISGKAKFGNYIHISVYCYVFGGPTGVEMEDFSGLAHGVQVLTSTDDYSGESMTNPMVPDKYKLKKENNPVLIGRHCIVGSGSIILPGATLQAGTAVGAMSMVKQKTEPWSIYVGIPAKKVKDRSKKLLALEKEFLKEQDAI